MGRSLDDIGFLAHSEHRTGVLDALSEERCDRNDLRAATEASPATIARVLADFEERRWIDRDGSLYGLTPLGEFVAERFAELRNAMAVEAKLRDVWRWLPREMEGFSVDLFADAVVSYPGPGYPYEPVERVSRLIRETTAMRGFGTTVFKSVNNETLCERVIEGMDYEYIFPPDVLEATIEWDPEQVAKAAARENCTVLLHDDLPDKRRCGIGIFDDRIGICCHDADTHMLEAVIDTANPDARDWAVSVYDRNRTDARPISTAEKAELFPDDLVV